MTRVLRFTLAVGLVTALAAGAAGPPVKPAVEADQLDYLFLASDRPVLLRLHVRNGDKAYDAEWHAFMDKMFAWFDKDNDGALSGAEPARVPQAQILSFQLQGSIGGQNPTPVPLATLDTNKDGKVSKEEFKAYYRNNGISAMRFAFNNGPAVDAKRINDAIYKRLDANKDSKLTEPELARLPELLRQLDENEDELLTSQELNTEGSEAGYGNIAFVQPVMRGQARVPSESGLLEFQPGTGSRYVGQLIGKYDKNKDGKIAKTEIPFSDAEFAALDANKDGLIDAKEMAAFFDREPDLVFRAQVGAASQLADAAKGVMNKLGMKGPVAPERVTVANPKKRPMPVAAAVKQISPEAVAFDLGDSRFQLHASGGQGQRFNNTKQFYVQEFDNFADKKGYVDRAQEKENRQRPFLFQLFTWADKDGDGKLMKKELEGWLDLTGEGMNCHVSLTVTDQGRGVFEVMDGNGDGRLSIRETRTVWQRVRPLCKDGAHLVQAELPRTLRIQLAQGAGFNGYAVPVAFGGMGPQPVQPSGRGPMWFRKMDRNNDGDISPKEWLGSEDDFKRIDLDGDGLISLEEALKYEAARKGQKK